MAATTTTQLPAAGAGRGSAARIACPAANDCWLVTWARLALPLQRRDPPKRDTDPNFEATINFRPNESAEQFIPDRSPVDDSLLFARPRSS